MSQSNTPVNGASLVGNQSALNTFNANPADIDSYNEALQNSVQALKDRYAQPNWFNVAAGFAKPQLGGFTASMGSASQALGDWQEQQRAQQLPISQMQQQIALNKITMGQNAKIASDEAARKAAGTPITSEYLSTAQSTAPNSPVTTAIGNAYTSQQKERELSHSELADAQTRVNYANSTGMNPDSKDLAILQGGSPTQKNPIAGPVVSGAGSSNISASSNPYQDSADIAGFQDALKTATDPADIASLQKNIARLQGKPNTKNIQDDNQTSSNINTQSGTSPQGFTGATAPQANALSAENLKNRESTLQPQIDQILKEGDPKKVKDTLHITSALTDLFNDPKVASAVGQLYGSQGIGNSLANLVQHGLSGNVDTPGGGVGASIKVDADNFMANMNVDADTRKKLRNVNDLVRQLETKTLQANTQAVGGGHQNQSEFQSAMLNMHGSGDPIETLKRAVGIESLKNLRAGSEANDYMDYLKDPNNARASHGNYLYGDRRKDVLKKYDPLISNAYKGQ